MTLGFPHEFISDFCFFCEWGMGHIFHHMFSGNEWIGLRVMAAGKPHDLHGKIYGFRLNFSFKPIH